MPALWARTGRAAWTWGSEAEQETPRHTLPPECQPRARASPSRHWVDPNPQGGTRPAPRLALPPLPTHQASLLINIQEWVTLPEKETGAPWAGV